VKLIVLAPNMTEYCVADTTVLFSYATPVAARVPGRGYIRTATRYSNTTNRHITKWLDGIDAEIVPQAEIDALVA
jgi:hypothetical protein